jgi:putative transposase
MKKSKFTEEQVVYALKQAEAGVPIKELCRKYGVSDATFYAWRKKYGGLGAEEMRRLKQLEDENRRLKGLVADLALDKQILQDVLSKNVWSAPRLQSHQRPTDQTVCANVSGLSVESSHSGPRWKSACVRPL